MSRWTRVRRRPRTAGGAEVWRSLLLRAAHSRRLKKVALATDFVQPAVRRFVAGESIGECLEVVAGLFARGLHTTVDVLSEDTLTVHQADAVTDTYVELLSRVSAADLGDGVEVSIKLSSLGARLSGGRDIAVDNARLICAAAAKAGTTVTVDAEEYTTTDDTRWTVDHLRTAYPATAAVVQAYLHRSEADCRQLAGPGSRVRLCKGAYAEPASVAYQSRREIDAAYLRCLEILLRGEGHPLVATHDPVMIEAALRLAGRLGRDRDSFEIQMLHGIRPDEQVRLADAGYRVRVYVPFGRDWYGYFLRRLAERPSNLLFVAPWFGRRISRDDPALR